jgi:hypothetical protein
MTRRDTLAKALYDEFARQWAARKWHVMSDWRAASKDTKAIFRAMADVALGRTGKGVRGYRTPGPTSLALARDLASVRLRRM